MSNSFGQAIIDLLDEGFDVQVGPHTEGLPGYYAFVGQLETFPKCDECENPLNVQWDECGHGWSASAALNNAKAIAETGKPLATWKPENFV